MSSYLYNLDFSDSIVGLTFNGRRRYKTSSGGFLTLLLYCGITAIILFNVTEYFTRKFPKMWFEIIKYGNPPKLDISYDFIFALKTKYQDNIMFHDDVFKIEAVYHNVSLSIWDSKILPKFNCNTIQNETVLSLLKEMDISDGLCFDINHVILGGSVIQHEYQYLQIQLKFCLDEIHCMPLEDMESFLSDNNPSVVFYYIDTVNQIRNRTKLIDKYLNHIDSNLTLYNTKETNIYFSQNEMKVENDYFLSDKPTVYSSYIMDSFRDLTSVRTNKQDIALSLNLFASKKKEIIHVSYTKLPELFAKIGALMNILMLIFNSTSQYLNHFLFQDELIHSLFRVNSIPFFRGQARPGTTSIKIDAFERLITMGTRKATISLQSISDQKTIETNHSSQSPQILPTKLNLKFGQNRRSVYKSDRAFKRKQFAFSLKDLIIICFTTLIPCLTLKYIVMKKKTFVMLNKMIFTYQDMKNIFKKLQEVDLLKYLLFTEEQIALYQLIPQPEYVINENFALVPQLSNDFSSTLNKKSFHYLKSFKDINMIMNKIRSNEKCKLADTKDSKGTYTLDNKLTKMVINELMQLEQNNSV